MHLVWPPEDIIIIFWTTTPIIIGNDCLINPGFFISSGTTLISSAGCLAGAADIFGAGGGQVIWPSFIT